MTDKTPKNKTLPQFETDEDAQKFTDEADLSEYDLSGFKPLSSFALIRAKLIEGERSGFSDKSIDDIWEEARTEHHRATIQALIEGEESGTSERTPEDIRRAVQERAKHDGII